jgi:hypothetical protein
MSSGSGDAGISPIGSHSLRSSVMTVDLEVLGKWRECALSVSVATIV